MDDVGEQQSALTDMRSDLDSTDASTEQDLVVVDTSSRVTSSIRYSAISQDRTVAVTVGAEVIR